MSHTAPTTSATATATTPMFRTDRCRRERRRTFSRACLAAARWARFVSEASPEARLLPIDGVALGAEASDLFPKPLDLLRGVRRRRGVLCLPPAAEHHAEAHEHHPAAHQGGQDQ